MPYTQPTGQSKKRKSRTKRTRTNVLTLCQCTECSIISNFDPTRGVYHGVYLTQYQYESHTSLENRRKNAILTPIIHKREDDLPDLVSTLDDDSDDEASEWSDDNEPWTGISSSSSLESLEETLPLPAPSSPSPPAQSVLFFDELAEIKLGLEATPAFTFSETLDRVPLVFLYQPEEWQKEAMFNPSDFQDFDLQPSATPNFPILQYEAWLEKTNAYLTHQRHRPMSDREHARFTFLSRKGSQEVRDMKSLRRDNWLKRRDLYEQDRHRRVETSRYVDSTLEGLDPTTVVTYLLSLMLYLFGNLSEKLASLNLSGIALALSLAFRDIRGFEYHRIPQSLPKDIRTVLGRIDLEPKYKSFVCCPDCFKTYYIDPDNPFFFPEFCDYQQTPNSRPCRTRLRDRSTTVEMKPPSRVFLYQDLRHWIGRLHARKDLEGFIKEYPRNRSGAGRKLEDIWDASVLDNFPGPDGKPFLESSGDESRLIFGLNMDGFNPYGNREAGKKVSIGGIYLVCFNLPPTLRNKMENIFLAGIVPGPQEPSTHQVNHVLRPLVDDLRLLWETGVFLSKTSSYPNGRPVRAAMVPLICDLPAARRAVGLGSHSLTHFCSECDLTLQDINNLDTTTWTPRDYNTHIRHATNWRDAPTETVQDQTFKAFGVKWSELLRLPYWDPTRFVVMDSMHGFYLRMFMRHVRDVWGMQVNIEDGDGLPHGDLEDLSEDSIAEIQRVLRYEPVAKLRKLKKGELQYLCSHAGLHYGGQKSWMVKLLAEHRVNQGWFTPGGDLIFGPPPPPLQPACSGSFTTPSSDKSSFRSSGDPTHLDKVTIQPSPCTVNVLSQLQVGSNEVSTLDDHDRDLLRLFQEGLKSTIDQTKKNDLVRLCQLTEAEQEANNYDDSNKPSLAEILHSRRRKAGITTSTNKVIKKTAMVEIPLAGGVPVQLQIPIAEEIRASDLAQLDTLYHTKSKAGLSRTKKALLVALCAVRFAEVSRNHHEFNQMNRKSLVELIHEQRLAEGLVDEDGDLFTTQERGSTAVLGAHILSEIRNDMNKTETPSWWPSAPKHPGEVKWGKFKAEEWRSFCLVNLPITLTRLWGTLPKESRQYQMLDNYMLLVNAIKIATSHSITHEMITTYEQYILRYLQGFLRLYPHKNLTPYQHMSLHFGEHLRRFGPTHSWRCNAFERMNGLVQALPSNSRFGQLEKAKFLRFCRVQNLRGLLAGCKVPKAAYPILQLYTKHCMGGDFVFQTGKGNSGINRGTSRLLKEVELRFLKEMVTSREPHASHFSRKISIYPKVHFNDTDYASGSGTRGSVLFQSQHGEVEKAGVMNSIFAFSYRLGSSEACLRTEMFSIIKPYLELSKEDTFRDPFRQFDLAGGFLCQDRLGKPEIIPFSKVWSQFAHTRLQIEGIPGNLIHVLPLFK